MGSFRRVEGEQAGSEAVGILVPPGKRTFLILRPRSLPWDLLLCRGPDEWTFAQLAHDEASVCAQKLYRALRDWAAGGPGVIESVDVGAEGSGSLVRVMVGSFVLVVCPRTPGQPYVPLLCGGDEAKQVGASLVGVLCPRGNTEQELYFNTRFFERSGSR
jgi:hypothetical protein